MPLVTSTEQGLALLGPVARRIAASALDGAPPVRWVFKGSGGQVLLALDNRMLIIKPPGFQAFSVTKRVTVFPYHGVNAIELNMGLASGTLEVITAGYSGRERQSFWVTDAKKGNNAFRNSNVVPLFRGMTKEAEACVAWIREQLLKTHAEQKGSPTFVPNVVDEIEKLASLRESGIVSAEEFEDAKQRLLSGF